MAVDPACDDAKHLLAASDEEFYRRCAGAEQSRLDLDDFDHDHFRDPQGSFFVASLEGEPVGCCGITRHALGGEIKRMFVAQSARRRGVAKALIAAAQDWAMTMGIDRVVLETGPQLPEAIALYRNSGYRPIPSYPPYDQWSSSLCFEKLLSQREPTS